MRTSVVGVRLTEYQRERLKNLAKERSTSESDLVREQIDKLIDKRQVDISGLQRLANKRGVTCQRLVDLIVEELNE